MGFEPTTFCMAIVVEKPAERPIDAFVERCSASIWTLRRSLRSGRIPANPVGFGQRLPLAGQALPLSASMGFQRSGGVSRMYWLIDVVAGEAQLGRDQRIEMAMNVEEVVQRHRARSHPSGDGTRSLIAEQAIARE